MDFQRYIILLSVFFLLSTALCSAQVEPHPTDVNIFDIQASYVDVADDPPANENGEVDFGEDLYLHQPQRRFVRKPRPRAEQTYSSSIVGPNTAWSFASSYDGVGCIRRLSSPRAAVEYQSMRMRRSLDSEFAQIEPSEAVNPHYQLQPYSCERLSQGRYVMSFQVTTHYRDPYSGVRKTERRMKSLKVYGERQGSRISRYLDYLYGR